MTIEPTPVDRLDSPASSGAGSGFARVFWTLLGPLLLLGVLIHNVLNPGGWLTRWDAAVVVLVAAMIGCRWIEQRSGHAVTAYGEPATPAHFRRYVLVLIAAAAAAWVLANMLGNHLLN